MPYKLTIPGWHPARLNDLLGHWSIRQRRKRSDRELVAFYALEQRIPPATGRRRVDLTLTLARRQRAGDPDAYWKSLLDALTAAGLLRDDNRQGVELGRVAFARGDCPATVIELEDLPPIQGGRRCELRRRDKRWKRASAPIGAGNRRVGLRPRHELGRGR